MRLDGSGKTYPSATSLKKCSANTPRGSLSCSPARTFDFSLVSRYPELRGLEIRQLARTLLSADSDRTLRSLKEEIESYTGGRLPHAKHVVSALYRLMESDQSVDESPLPMATPSNQQAPSGDWGGLKKALTSSLTSGTFLDSQFYAVESRSSSGLPKICPIYFCSMAGGSFMPKLMACESLLEIMCGRDIDPPLQVPQNSRRGKRPLDWRMGMTATLRTRSPTKSVPWTVARTQNGS